jgi:hypothetical protein
MQNCQWLKPVLVPLERFAFLGLAPDHARSRFEDWRGVLWADKYHTKNVCQDCFISAQDLTEGEFSSILALLMPE